MPHHRYILQHSHLWPLTLKTFSAMPIHMVNICARSIEIPPPSTEILCHVKQVLSDGQPDNGCTTGKLLIVGSGGTKISCDSWQNGWLWVLFAAEPCLAVPLHAIRTSIFVVVCSNFIICEDACDVTWWYFQCTVYWCFKEQETHMDLSSLSCLINATVADSIKLAGSIGDHSSTTQLMTDNTALNWRCLALQHYMYTLQHGLQWIIRV